MDFSTHVAIQDSGTYRYFSGWRYCALSGVSDRIMIERNCALRSQIEVRFCVAASEYQLD